jgi:NAD(P)-dependent dehydrogenase (short-subunit alcohol dehydrogenase family)
VLLTVVDVSKQKKVEDWIAAIVAEFGGLDGAANIARVYIPKPLMQATDRDWEIMMNVNLLGVYNCLRAQIPRLPSRGSIVRVPSTREGTHHS